MKTLIPLLFLLSLTSLCIRAQISHGGTPYSFENGLSAVGAVKIMPAVDAEEMKSIDEMFYLEKGRSIRFGEEIKVSYNLDNSGEWTELPNNDRVWRLKIKAPNAFHINLIYDDFFMPQGARFFLYNENGTEVLGEFNSGNNKSYGTFSTGFVRGDATVLEYYEPAAVSGQGKLSVSTVVHGYRNMLGSLEKGYGDSGSCNINVNCPEGADWQTTKTSVAKIVNGGFDHCTGSMLNNVEQDCTPYFLTAEHCGGGEQNWVFYFNWESPGCSNQNIPMNQSVSGGQVVADLSSGDFELLELSSAPPVDYNVFYAGWNANPEPADNSVCIHHPAGDIKKISFNNDPLVPGQTWGSSSHWRITEWEEGTTEGGSSGSALFDLDQRVIGMLTGGSASCFNSSGYDEYGRMSYNWDTGNNSSSRLRDWLDPNNTGSLAISGYDCSNPGGNDTCSDGILNGSETSIDCGGNCPPCGSSCNDGVQNSGETGVDCGGPCEPCDNTVKVQVKMILEGAKLSGNFMKKDLYQNDLLPLQQPYNVAPYNYSGGEAMADYSDFPASTVDWIYIQIRSSTDRTVVLGERAALLKSDGRIMDLDGTIGVNFEGLTAGETYRIVLFHKSHLAVMSAADVTLPNSSQYDFTTSIFKAAGDNQMLSLDGKAVLRSGEYNGNGTVNFADFIAWLGTNNFLDQYLFTDGDCNGTVNFFDFVLWLKNNNTIRYSEI